MILDELRMLNRVASINRDLETDLVNFDASSFYLRPKAKAVYKLIKLAIQLISSEVKIPLELEIINKLHLDDNYFITNAKTDPLEYWMSKDRVDFTIFEALDPFIPVGVLYLNSLLIDQEMARLRGDQQEIAELESTINYQYMKTVQPLNAFIVQHADIREL